MKKLIFNLCAVPHVKVTIVDLCGLRIAEWNSNNLPIYVPALDEVKELREELVLFFGRADV